MLLTEATVTCILILLLITVIWKYSKIPFSITSLVNLKLVCVLLTIVLFSKCQVSLGCVPVVEWYNTWLIILRSRVLSNHGTGSNKMVIVIIKLVVLSVVNTSWHAIWCYHRWQLFEKMGHIPSQLHHQVVWIIYWEENPQYPPLTT